MCHQDLKYFADVADAASNFCEMTYTVHTLLAKLPVVKNINLRKSTAKVFLTEMTTERKWPIGESATKYLQSFSNNGTPPSKGTPAEA